MLNLPIAFRESIQEILGDDVQNFERVLNTPSPVSIRINKNKKADLSHLSLQNGVEWCNNGHYLSERPVFTLDPLLHQGAYYVQEASSMYVEHCLKHILNEGEPVVALDLCAAPGGKSTHLASVLPANSLLVSNEVIRSRAHILHENICKWGFPNSVITNNDPKDFAGLHHFFDVILVDAPCSGEGMFRKDHDAVNEWSKANVRLCAERQQRILVDIWTALKPNGFLIYSTCTFNVHENENNIQWLIDTFGAESVDIPFDKDWGVSPSLTDGLYAARFYPHRTKGEGLFMAVVRKTEGNYQKRNNRLKSTKSNFQKISKDFTQVTNWLVDAERYTFIQQDTNLRAIPTDYYCEVERLTKHLRLLNAGVNLGQIKGRDIIPDISLAMSIDVNQSQFVLCELDHNDTIKYLRKEPILLPDMVSKGYVLLTHQGKGLGWVKNLGNRVNNLYPQEWRIRMKA